LHSLGVAPADQQQRQVETLWLTAGLRRSFFCREDQIGRTDEQVRIVAERPKVLLVLGGVNLLEQPFDLRGSTSRLVGLGGTSFQSLIGGIESNYSPLNAGVESYTAVEGIALKNEIAGLKQVRDI
jgi:hypothetical protein